MSLRFQVAGNISFTHVFTGHILVTCQASKVILVSGWSWKMVKAEWMKYKDEKQNIWPLRWNIQSLIITLQIPKYLSFQKYAKTLFGYHHHLDIKLEMDILGLHWTYIIYNTTCTDIPIYGIFVHAAWYWDLYLVVCSFFFFFGWDRDTSSQSSSVDNAYTAASGSKKVKLVYAVTSWVMRITCNSLSKDGAGVIFCIFLTLSDTG